MLNLISELNKEDNYREIIETMLQKKKSIKSEKSLNELIVEINNGYNWSLPVMQKIPKPDGVSFREIFMFNDEDALIQKTINGILYKNYNSRVSDHVFSYRKGVRTYNAAKYIQNKMRNNNLHGYKLDISNYFMSVNPNIIHNVIDELVTDNLGRKLLHDLMSIGKYIYKDDVYSKNLGIMPGCAISSFLANYLLKDIDEMISNKSVIYARYSDDLIFMCENADDCDSLLKNIKDKLIDFGLKINPKKVFKLSSKNTIDFLGLYITKDKIDINKETFVNTKKLIKEITNRYRRKLESSKIKSSDYYTKLAINKLNKLLYKSILYNEQEHKSGRMFYIFSNITTIDTLLKLEFYMKDSIRYVYTGKHNKANVKKIDDYKLEELGYKSMISLYNLYKLDKDLYKNEVYLLGLPIRNKEKFYEPKVLINENTRNFTKYKFSGSFANIYRNVIKGGHFYFNGIQVYAECLDINIINKEIRFGNIIIAKGNKVLLDTIKCNVGGNDLLLELENKTVSDYNDTNPNNLIDEYVNYALKDNLASKPSNVYAGVPRYNLFRKYSINDLANYYDINKVNVTENPEIREGLFLMYLYGHICSGVLWNGINYNHKLCKYKKDGITIVIPSKWIMGDK